MKTLHIFRAGQQTDINGNVINFTEADLAASAAAYDPKIHEAPIVVGHPKLDLPAYGWVSKLSADSTGLHADPDQVDASFAEMVVAGRFKKISASFYTPDAPNNPVKGVYYLRHVGFLGAAAPAIKGLKDVSFGEQEEGVVDFGDLDFTSRAIPRLLRGLRDWMIDKFSLEEADKVLPDWEINAMAEEAVREDVNDPTPAFSEPHNPKPPTEESIVTPEEKQRLESENAQLKADLAERDRQAKADATAKRHAEHVAYAEGLVTDKKLEPAKKDAVIAVLDALDGDMPLEFGEGDNKQPLATVFKGLLPTEPNSVLFSEHATRDSATAPNTVSFAAPSGYSVDSERNVLFQKAQQYAAQHNVNFDQAVKAVENMR